VNRHAKCDFRNGLIAASTPANIRLAQENDRLRRYSRSPRDIFEPPQVQIGFNDDIRNTVSMFAATIVRRPITGTCAKIYQP
jgi:hypothetical protein